MTPGRHRDTPARDTSETTATSLRAYVGGKQMRIFTLVLLHPCLIEAHVTLGDVPHGTGRRGVQRKPDVHGRQPGAEAGIPEPNGGEGTLEIDLIRRVAPTGIRTGEPGHFPPNVGRRNRGPLRQRLRDHVGKRLRGTEQVGPFGRVPDLPAERSAERPDVRIPAQRVLRPDHPVGRPVIEEDIGRGAHPGHRRA